MNIRVHCTAALLAVLMALPAAALAGRGEAEVALTAARSNLAAAERSGAPRHAPLAFESAVAMLQRAEGAYAEREWTLAERAAERAKADARLAEARARQARAETVLAELEAAIDTLRREIARGEV